MILLSKIVGWEEYLNGNTRIPITTNDNEGTISFTLKEKTDGIYEYLTMPYLSFWKFNVDGTTRPTGNYYVKNSSKGIVNLEAFNCFKDSISAHSIIFRSIDINKDDAYVVKENEIVIPSKSYEILSKNCTQIISTPSWLAFVEINPNRDFIKGNDQLKESLYQTLSDARKNLKLNPKYEF